MHTHRETNRTRRKRIFCIHWWIIHTYTQSTHSVNMSSRIYVFFLRVLAVWHVCVLLHSCALFCVDLLPLLWMLLHRWIHSLSFFIHHSFFCSTAALFSSLSSLAIHATSTEHIYINQLEELLPLFYTGMLQLHFQVNLEIV